MDLKQALLAQGGHSKYPYSSKAAKKLLQQVLTASSDELGYGRSGLPNRLNFNLQQHEQQYVLSAATCRHLVQLAQLLGLLVADIHASIARQHETPTNTFTWQAQPAQPRPLTSKLLIASQLKAWQKSTYASAGRSNAPEQYHNCYMHDPEAQADDDSDHITGNHHDGKHQQPKHCKAQVQAVQAAAAA